MTDPKPIDMDRDDELLAALGRGERPTPDDRVAVMLAAWRVDLTDPDATERSLRPVRTVVPLPEPDVPATRANPTSAWPGSRREGLGRRRPRRYRLAAAAAALAVLAGGTAAAASVAAPNSPLWPITQLIYPHRADRVAAQDALDQAREAIRDGRVEDANRLLDHAQALIANVNDPAERSRLRRDLDQLRTLLSSAGSVIAPGNTSSSRPQPSGGPGPAGTVGPTPGPLLPSPGLPLPGLPTSILPTQILPTSLLPSLPVIG